MRSRTELRGSEGDAGFTLVELIIAIVILGIITVPLSSVVIGFFRSADATTARLIESHDVQIATAYWAQDVASIGTRSTTAPYLPILSVWIGPSSPYPCQTTGNQIVSLVWDDSSGPGAATLVRVAYVVQAAPGQTQLTELHRLRCEGSPVVVSDVILAHDLDPSNLDPSKLPKVACSGTSGKFVTLTLTIKDPKNLGAAYVVTLTGQRRQS